MAARPGDRMGRRRSRVFWPTLFVLPALVLLIGLGIWQLHRLDEKAALLARIDAGLAAAPVTLPATIGDPVAWDYRRVEVAGVFLHDRELYLTGRTFRGQAGLQVVTPLRRTDAAAPGQVILVNRGWVPNDRRDRGTRPDGLPAAEVAVSGIVRRPPDRGWMQPDNEPAANLWFWVDLPAMSLAAGIAPEPTLILEADAQAADLLPIGGQTRRDIPNDHLQYAITWFGFAAILVVIYLMYLRRLAADDDAAGPANGPEVT